MERPRIFLDTKSTSSTSYQDLLAVKISGDVKGISYFTLSIDPDPNALYQIFIAKLMSLDGLELTAIWKVELPHLDKGVYAGFEPTHDIVVRHKSISGAITVKSGIGLTFNEVVER